MAPPMNPSREEMLAATFNPKIAKQGAKARKLAEARDVNTLPDPKTYAVVMGLLGEDPRSLGFSVAHPQYKEIIEAGEPAFVAGTAAQIIPAVKPVGKAVGKMAGQAMNERLLAGQSLTPGFNTPAPIMHVVKPEGGNWLGGHGIGNIDDQIKRVAPTGDRSASIKTMKAELASLENSGDSQHIVDLLKADIVEAEKDQALYNWTTRNLKNYVKKEMGTPSDPVRKLADEGIVHAPHGEYVDPDSALYTQSKRRNQGFPEHGMAKTQEGADWERLSDEAIEAEAAGDIQRAGQSMPRYFEKLRALRSYEEGLPLRYDQYLREKNPALTEKEIAALQRSGAHHKAQVMGESRIYNDLVNAEVAYRSPSDEKLFHIGLQNPWIEKLPGNEKLYSASISDLGFDHILDVLREDVRAGRIRPEQLSKVSMEQAVRRTHEYDQEMAKRMQQSAAAEQQIFPVHKEYPEGYKWIELAMPKMPNELPAGWTMMEPKAGLLRADVPDNSGRGVNGRQTVLGTDMQDLIKNIYKRNPHISGNPYKTLEDALTREGDTMGHCVGGYCPDVVSGKSRIYSLRDPKNQSHVTIETAPVRGTELGLKMADLPDEEAAQLLKNPPHRIVQIKGKQNQAPIAAYLPYVQDFVKSGNWSDVGDIKNTGLRLTSDAFNANELQKIKEAGIEVPRYATQEEIKAIGNQVWPGMWGDTGYKAGGEVKATPVKNKPAHGVSKALHAVHEFASKPFGYNNPPGEMISEMLGIPATARTLERMGYGEPLTTGKGMTTKPKADTMDALMAVAPVAPITKGLPVGAVIKNKGGNWLTNDVEKSLDSLLTKGTINNRQIAYGPEFEAARANRIKELRDAASQPGYKGGAEKVAEHLEQDLKDNPRLNETALNKWIQSNLTNYIKKEMATPEDPVRKLAEQGIVHMNIEQAIPSWQYEVARKNEGFPRGGLGQSQQAKDWENLSDAQFRVRSARQLIDPDAMEDIVPMYRKLQTEVNLKNNPWLEKLDPETKIYSTALGDLGFHHIIDVLRQDLASGRIRPEQLSKVSMDQAVRRTYEFDQEMAKKMRDAVIKQTEGMPVHKEYPEGYKWIELALPEKGEHLLTDLDHRIIQQRQAENPVPQYLMDRTLDQRAQQKLEEALKYEGDTMGHCVGGYCPDVLEGRSRIYSLRDAKGEPHVTIEVQPIPHPVSTSRRGDNFPEPTGFEYGGPYSPESPYKPTQDQLKQIHDRAQALWSTLGTGRAGDVDKFYQQASDEVLGRMPERIVQIKGKQNRAPKEEYLPFVQDFVKSGKWSDVGDLGNTGLYRANPQELGMFIPEDPRLRNLPGRRTDDLMKAKEAGLFGDQEYLTRKEWEDILRRQIESESGPLPPDEGMKAGGEVKMGIGGLLARGPSAIAKAEKAKDVIKASEAFGAHEGLPVYITQADRTKVGQGFLGGPGFSGLQQTSEPHREAMAAWGVKNPGTAKTIIGDPMMGENPLFTTMIGSPTQHQSNQMVFDKLYKLFKSEAKKGNLPDELRFMINDKLAKAVDKEGKNIFPPNVDILGKDFHKMADTFDRRSIAGHLMGGVGVGGKKGQIIDYDKVIKSTTDPGLIDAPSGAIGNRMFTLDKNIVERPDLHPAFPTIMTGQDLGVVYDPVPREIFMQDFINKVRAEKGRDPGYMDYTRGRPPSQFISEKWLTDLQKKGYKKGGLLKVKRKK